MNIKADNTQQLVVPFDHEKLDRLMDAAGIDLLVATSKHNVQYLLGGYKFIFFAAMDAIGHSRYLPVVVYEKGRPDHAAYVGNRMEGGEHANRPFWTPNVHTAAWGTVDAANLAADHIRKIARPGARIGIEPPFLPSDAHAVFEQLGNSATLVDATSVFERLARHQDTRGTGQAARRFRTDYRFNAGDHRMGAAKVRPRPRSSRNCAGRRPGAACISSTAC